MIINFCLCFIYLFIYLARLVHLSHIARLQERYARQLLVLVSNDHPEQQQHFTGTWRCKIDSVFLLRYVIVECEDQDTKQRDPKTHEMYLNVMRRFSQALLKVSVSLTRLKRDMFGSKPAELFLLLLLLSPHRRAIRAWGWCGRFWPPSRPSWTGWCSLWRPSRGRAGTARRR